MTNYDTLADRIRSEAATTTRPGRMAALEAIADEVERLRQGAKTLGHIVEQQGRMALGASGMHHVIGEDGDGDWAVVWESLYDIRPRALDEAADLLADLADTFPEAERASIITAGAFVVRSLARTAREVGFVAEGVAE